MAVQLCGYVCGFRFHGTEWLCEPVSAGFIYEAVHHACARVTGCVKLMFEDISITRLCWMA